MWDVVFDEEEEEDGKVVVQCEWLGLGLSSDRKGKSSGVEWSGNTASAWKSERLGNNKTVHDCTVID